MTWQAYSDAFTAAAQQAGRSQDFVATTLAYAQRLWDAKLPVVFDDAHLAALLGFELQPLHTALERSRSLYKTSYIPKHSGGQRRIDAPVASLKGCQSWILRNILQGVPVHPAATAFHIGRSIRDNAKVHARSAIVISVDVRDFFSSLRAERCQALFADLGYRTDVAEMLTKITTLEGGLPQGAPSSPALSNLLMREFDKAMTEFASEAGVRYTRYADDVTVSGVCRPGTVIETCAALLSREGLTLNEQKTRVMFPHQRQEVTGVVVNDRLQAPRELRRYLRHQIHMIKAHGVPRHVVTDPISVEEYKQHLRGVAEFVLFVNPDDRDAKYAISLLGRVVFQAKTFDDSKS